MITLTQNAKNHLKSLSEKHNKPFVRLEVKGGGCAGFEYEWTFSKGPDDNDIVVDNILLIDKMFELYIVGMELDYVEEIFGSNFVFKNPQAKNTCGCGTSFSI
jgi:iron-sulfur cluster assembly accessory protein|tara:strand:- start:55 stop:363 length:309 start_codon:yes stop_codon:yes gene_type:complete